MTLEQFGALVDRFGLSAVLIALIVLAFYKRWVVTRGELADKQDELDKMSALYERERTDRIAAQDAIGRFAPANAEVAQAVAELSEQVIKRLPDPYGERLEGTRRRVR